MKLIYVGMYVCGYLYICNFRFFEKEMLVYVLKQRREDNTNKYAND